MDTRATILMIISIVLTVNLNAQEAKKNNYREQTIDSKRQIKELHNGVLLVSLKQKQKLVEGLRKRGIKSRAKKVDSKQNNRNKYIMDAFKTNFDFCPVYFFYSSDSKHITENNIDSITFINENYLKDNSIILRDSIFYIAEFGQIKPNKNLAYQSSQNPKNKKQNFHTGGTDFRFKALSIKNKEFKQLNAPFPYSKEDSEFNEKVNIKNAVSKLNLKLNEFYKQHVN